LRKKIPVEHVKAQNVNQGPNRKLAGPVMAQENRPLDRECLLCKLSVELVKVKGQLSSTSVLLAQAQECKRKK